MTENVSFDFRGFLRRYFKTPAGVVSFLRAYGASLPEEEAVRKWFSRGAVPADWFAVLLAYVEIDEGAPPRLAPFLGRL